MSMAIAVGNLGGPSAHGGYGDSAAQRRRVELREFGSRLSDHGELAGCGRTIRKGRGGSATEILEVTTSCRRKWLCPTCGYTASRKEAAKLTRRLLGWTAQGGAVALLTLTQSHCPDDGLAPLWSHLEAGWAALVRGSGWTADKRAYGVRGYVRVTELVHNAAAGWNVHFHVILLLDQELDQPQHASAARFPRCEVRSRRRAQWRSRGGGSPRLATDDAGDRGTVGQLSLQGNQVPLVDRRLPHSDGHPRRSGIHRRRPAPVGRNHRRRLSRQAHAGDHLHAHRLPAPKIAHYSFLLSREMIQLPLLRATFEGSDTRPPSPES